MERAIQWQPWEAENTRDLLIRLIGHELGRHPERHIEKIRSWRANLVEFFDTCFLQLKRDEVALEIGSGCGFTSRELARRVRELHCIDISRSFLEYARRECADQPNISFHEASYTDLRALPTASIDAVLASAVFIHADLYAVNLFLGELSRIMRPGGRIVFDYLDSNRLAATDPLFLAHTDLYRQNPQSYPELCKWNSGHALVNIARQHGFTASTTPRSGGAGSILFGVNAAMSRWSLHWRTVRRVRRFDRQHSPGFTKAPEVTD